MRSKDIWDFALYFWTMAWCIVMMVCAIARYRMDRFDPLRVPLGGLLAAAMAATTLGVAVLIIGG
jgi:hypothetical protein